MNQTLNLIQDGLIIFLGIIFQALPFILLGVFISTLLSEMIRQETLLKFFPKSRVGSLLFACFLGFLFPVCECGNVPVARKLVQKGLSPAAVLTFLFSAPALNPLVILVTFTAFPTHPEIAVYRMLFTFLIAFAVGLIFSFHPQPEQMLALKLRDERALACHVETITGRRFRWNSFFQAMSHEFFEMMMLLIPGALFASFTQILLPSDLIFGIGKGPVLSIVAMILLAFVLSVCSNVDAFLALSYFNIFTSGSIVAFLTFGPMIDIKSIFMFRGIFTKKVIAFSCLLILLLTLLTSLFLNFLVY